MPIMIPPDPSPIRSIDIDSKRWLKALTPKTSAVLNAQVAAGEIAPYTYTCLMDQDYLTLGAWFQDVRRYVADVQATIAYYKRAIAQQSEQLKGESP